MTRDDAARALRNALVAALPDTAHDNPEIARMRHLMCDYPLRTGKLVRGSLMLLSSLAHGADAGSAMPSAVALELFQSWVLIHDDIEDGSLVRRGRPALHRLVGMPVALNVGDALHVHMWAHLIRSRVAAAVTDEFLDMIARTAEGQHLDLAWVEHGRLDVSEQEYLEMVRLKTGWYTVASPLRLGAATAGRHPAAEFASAGLDLGAAFQIRDDVLNLTADDASAGGYGKERAGDLTEAKRTLVVAHFHATARTADTDRAAAILLKDASEDELSWLLEALAANGSIAYAQQRAEELSYQAMKTLRTVFDALPHQAAASEALALLESLASRTS